MISSAISARAIFYSHEREQEIAGEFLGAQPGFFVDVGANDPKEGSQSWHLEQRGWTGVLVEPLPELADKLRRQRAAKVYGVACSSPANAGRTMTLYRAGIQSSLNPEHWVYKMQRDGSVEVPVRTLNDILTDAKAPAPLDFVSIDVETHEIDVLEGFDLERWRPKLLLIEDMVFDRRLHRYIESRGYRWVRRTAINSWYVPASSPMRVSLFGKLQFFRKYFLGVPFRHLREAVRRFRS